MGIVSDILSLRGEEMKDFAITYILAKDGKTYTESMNASCGFDAITMLQFQVGQIRKQGIIWVKTVKVS